VGEITEERPLNDPAANLRIWRIPQCPFLMECSAEVLEQIRREVEAGRALPRGEREIGGVLFGIQESDSIRVLASKPLQCEHALGPGFVLSEKDEKRLTQLISAPATAPELNALQPLGWYHSHIRSRIFLSERDLQVHSRHFGAPFQIAMVIHPESERPTRAGFFFREASGEMRAESAYEEFTVEAPPPAAPEPGRPVVSKRAASDKRTPSSRKPEPQKTELLCPRCGSQRLRRSRRTGPMERLRGIFGFDPYRCHECLSRSFLKTSSGFLELARSNRRRRPEERKRARQRTRREVLLWCGSVFGFLAILYYLIRDTGPKQDAP
jgi:proteasome lid subunit RPN8/RPN11/DNA-directed RNA polymerase subunit RPC12/RpoP